MLAMSRTNQKATATAILALGLAMSLWGGMDFTKSEPVAASGADEDRGPRMCPPTIGEILDLGPTARKMASLAVGGVGMLGVCGSVRFLAQRKEPS